MGKVHIIGVILLIGIVATMVGTKLIPTGSAILDGINEGNELALQIPLVDTAEERKAFLKEFATYRTFDLRDLYERWIDVIGANGLVASVEYARPSCHDEAHDLGKLIYEMLGDIGYALRTCEDACYSACMHGVLMEAFKEVGSTKDDHVDLETIAAKIPTLCDSEDFSAMYKPGDCAHGTGHAFMYLSSYNIGDALDICGHFETDAMQYYCTTGAYMEYVTTHDRRDSTSKSLFYPCDVYNYSAGCFRYKLVHVFRRHYQNKGEFFEIVEQCLELNGSHRRGCFHGIGNSHMAQIAFGKITFADVCKYGDATDQYVCIEGAIERMSKYYPKEALENCELLDGWQYDLCITGAKNKMYPLNKSFEYYIS